MKREVLLIVLLVSSIMLIILSVFSQVLEVQFTGHATNSVSKIPSECSQNGWSIIFIYTYPDGKKEAKIEPCAGNEECVKSAAGTPYCRKIKNTRFAKLDGYYDLNTKSTHTVSGELTALEWLRKDYTPETAIIIDKKYDYYLYVEKYNALKKISYYRGNKKMSRYYNVYQKDLFQKPTNDPGYIKLGEDIQYTEVCSSTIRAPDKNDPLGVNCKANWIKKIPAHPLETVYTKIIEKAGPISFLKGGSMIYDGTVNKYPSEFSMMFQAIDLRESEIIRIVDMLNRNLNMVCHDENGKRINVAGTPTDGDKIKIIREKIDCNGVEDSPVNADYYNHIKVYWNCQSVEESKPSEHITGKLRETSQGKFEEFYGKC